MDWTLFFPPGARVLALPSWRSPRLYLTARDLRQRWAQSGFYPASRMSARLYRFLLRVEAGMGVAQARRVHSAGWPLEEFAGDVLPRLASAVVLVGTPGPAQEITAQLRDGDEQVLGYLKYAEGETPRRRLQQEWSVLSGLPDCVGPRPLKFGPLGSGEALLQSMIPGKPLPVTLPPPRDLTGLLDSLVVGSPVSLEAHPWTGRMRGCGLPALEAWLEPLADRDWPVAIQHGDFAPWNLIREPDGALRAIDWEYGSLESFPYLDLAYYLLQTSALVYRRAPRRGAEYAARYLSRQGGLNLSGAQARALVRLAACDAYRQSAEDGQPPDARLQIWRRAVWSS